MLNFLKKLFSTKKNQQASPIIIQSLDEKSQEFLFQKYKNILLNEYLSDAENDFSVAFNHKLQIEKLKYQENFQNVVLEILDRINLDFCRENFIVKIKCSNPEIRSRLVGLNGRNKKAFERACGVELLISTDDEYIQISSANHIKREIAINVLNRLIEIKNIEPNKIENYFIEETKNFLNHLENIGKNAIENDMKIKTIDSGIYQYVGRLKYRYSFGQNILEHSIECALIAEQIAILLKLDPKLAKIAAFFHDIGKSVDHETNLDHIDQGVELAKKYNLPNEVIQAIAYHHESSSVPNIYCAITKLADKISASKPGARKNIKDDFIQRAKNYEDICMQFKEVKTCYTLKSGFLLKVIVKPNLVKDDELELLAYRIKKALQDNPETKQYVITIELIKENIFKLKTNNEFVDK